MTTLTYTDSDGNEHELSIEKLGGRGEVGDLNWGSSDPFTEDELEPVLEQFHDHLGEPAVLSGGGGPGYDIVILEDAAIEHVGWGPDRGQYKIRATVTLITGKLSRHGRRGEEFTPWIDSWQISVFPDERDREYAVQFVEAQKSAYEIGEESAAEPEPQPAD